ncbi:MAG: MarC family protein [Roseitalea porphyridii]|uniref:MarC family protein n=1 Tax=Roseitalea porphyridii TaxID=1852022 RepID=UPI0032D97D49
MAAPLYAGAMTLDLIINATVTLLVTIDPVGLAPLFLAVTGGMDRAQRRETGTRAIVIGFAVMVLFAVLGTPILALFGVTLAAFRVAGGLLLFWIAFEMIFEKRQERHENTANRAISALVLLSGDFAGPLERAALIGIVAAILALTWVIFILAERVDRLLGETGRSVLTRLLGVILSALAVQFVADGVRTLAAA